MNMVESDSAIDHNHDQQEVSKESPVVSLHSLLSHERSQKFDFVLYLISNLSQPIVLCGPDGIGKTTVLQEIRAQRLNSWLVCFLESSADLSLEGILQKLQESLPSHIDSRSDNDALSKHLKQMEENNQCLVLTLDDAGYLLPGTVESLCQYAENHSALRLVLSMRPDHYHVKATTDVSIENCHTVDLPPLTKKECGEFLSILSADPQRLVSFKGVETTLVDRVYKETHGIPGEIIKVLPKVDKGSLIVGKNKINLVYVPVVAVLAIGMCVLLWKSLAPEISPPVLDGRKQEEKQMLLPVSVQNTDNITLAKSEKQQGDADDSIDSSTIVATQNISYTEDQSLFETLITEKDLGDLLNIEMLTAVIPEKDRQIQYYLEQSETQGNGSSDQEKPQAEISAQPSETTVTRSQQVEKPENRAIEATDQALFSTAPKPKQKNTDQSRETFSSTEKLAKRTSIPAKSKYKDLDLPGVQGADWLLAQNPAHWTLQLIVVSRVDSLKSLVKKHSDVQSFAAYRLRTKNKDLYPLVYGSYPTLAEAKQVINGLPPSLRKPWPRKFKVIHAEIQSAQGK